MNYEEFKKEYMSSYYGYIPTYVTTDEKYRAEGTIRINIEMIAPFRMTDGPSRFFRVIDIIINEEQYEEVKKYMSGAGDFWKEHLQEKISNCIIYSNKFKK